MRALFAAALAMILVPVDDLRWVRDGAPTPQALALVRVLESAALKGLDPEDYDSPFWAERLTSFGSRKGQRVFDEALTAAAERYVAHLAGGRVDPRAAGAWLDRESRVDARAFVRALASVDDVDASLREIETPFSAYHRMLAALRQYSDLARRDEGKLLPPAPRPVEPGERWDGAPRLARLLSLLGDLRAPAGDTDLYDGPLVDAVRRFQERHGLDPDGRVGPQTFRALNVPLSHRVLQIELALERLRWLPHRLAASPIVVNIPEYRLRAYGPGRALSLRVVVGVAYSHQTPVFASALRTVVFRPVWNVPRSIERDELLAGFERDPDAMGELGFEAVDRAGKVVTGPEAVERLRAGELRLRQRPGPRNALGLLKFDLPNPFGVYLHGTPVRALFGRTRRDLSHGCIRVEQAEELAARVLDWPVERVRAATRGPRTLRVAVRARVPVLVLYSTAVVRDDGAVQFFEDVYGHDAALERVLEGSRAQHFRTSADTRPQDSRLSDAAPELH